MRMTAVEKPRPAQPDRRRIDLTDLSDIPAFLLVENRPKDWQARTDARIREYQAKQAAAREPLRKGVPRYVPKEFR